MQQHAMAPHSCEQFAAQLGCHPKSISRIMGGVLGTGYFKRYNRYGNKPLYTRFNIDEPIETALYMKYKQDDRTTDADGVNPYIEPVPKELRKRVIGSWD